MSYGWTEKVLWVNLSKGTVVKKPLEKALKRAYLSGRGLNSRRLYDLVKQGIEPFSSENVLIFGAGSLTGTLAPGGSRLTITAKSPLTNIFGDGNIGWPFWSRTETRRL